MQTKCLLAGVVVLFVLSILPDSAHAQIDPQAVVGLWLFDDGGGNVAKDSSGNGNDGTLNGPKWISQGKFEGALEFDGAGTYIEFATGENLKTPNFTIMAWFSTRKLTGYGHIFQTGNDWNDMAGYVFRVHQDGTVQGAVAFGPGNTTTFVTGPLIQANTWYHLAFTFDGTTATLYLDGENVASGAAGKIIYDDQPVRIGCLSHTIGSVFDGFIDEVALFNVALEANNIETLMNQGLSTIVGGSAEAFDPIPSIGQTDVNRDGVLSWTAGMFADTHDVYLGTAFGDVNDASRTNPLNVLARQDQRESTYDPGRLAFDTTYYWRVDEVNAPPDSKIFRGSIWTFTTEPVSYPIDGANITATASSSGQVNLGPENTINGSGLDENDLHSTLADDMWLSGNEMSGAWIQYEFDKLYKLHEMWVWNSNQSFEGLFGFGMKDVTVEYSTNGMDWTALAGTSQFAKAPGTPQYAHDTTVDFGGATAKYVKVTAANNWGGLLPQYGLSEVRFFSIPVVAREPSPDAGTVGVNPAVTLTWRAGREAATHNVYLSEDQQVVIDGTVPAVSVADASYSASLDLASTYYWRVDEINDIETTTTWQGNVWEFTTQEFIVVEDFEDYNDYPPDEIYSTWLDGYEIPINGSQVGNLAPPLAETVIIHGGSQSMPIFYSNTNGATYSEGKRTFAAAQNWTQYGVTTLSIWFQGTPGNTGQMYAKINNTKIAYNGAAANITLPGWQLWNIDLATSGAGLQSVNSIALGIDGNAAAGTLYFDDIALYAVPPVPVVEVSIANSDDDVEERIGPNNGAIDMGSSDLEMPYEDAGQVDPQIVGLRFTGIAVPQGATITDAWVQFTVDETKSGTQPVNLIIEGELSPSAAAFTSTAGNVSSRPKTSAKVQWSVSNWTAVGDAGPDQRTPNLASIIQEIVNQNGWTGEALVLIIRDNPANPSTGIRCAGIGASVVLHIDYQ